MARLALALTLILVALPLVAGAAPEAPPKEVFLASTCSTCHSVAGAGIRRRLPESRTTGPDLTGLTVSDPAALKSFLRRETNRGGRRHGIKVPLSDPELDAILAWLGQL